MSFITNPQLELAFEYVRNTHKNIFLTGKAGTGKTTFLHEIRKDSPKRMVVVAPTGVAAINAGGMTIHSFFQLPFGPFLPGNAHEVARQRKFSGEKIRLIQSIDLLVIDEISMVRADLLDGIDDVLRRYRDRSKPFGGVQLLMIGDLHQLPPVVKDEEWYLLREYYNTAYFFGSRALRDSKPVSIELKHIYRQSDETFIQLLNKVRDNKIDASVLETLNSRYVANFQPTEAEPYITLTAHNASAQELNAEKLAEIAQPKQSFKASIQGEFPPFAYPADEVFECKKGAQVMFVKNDLTREKRFYNGKIGKVIAFKDNTIYVRCPGESEDIEVQPVEWSNVKYALDEKTKEVTENILGSFTQYPLKLAWAITIHKSQGLTFERAIIDAQAAFAHGQVYVALSRCKSFEGIVLRTKIGQSSVKTDSVVKSYSDEADKNAPDEKDLSRAKADYQQSLLLELFSFASLNKLFIQMNRVCLEHERSLHKEAFEQLEALRAQFGEQVFSIAERFKPQAQYYFAQTGLPQDNPELTARLKNAGAYFEEKLGKEMLLAAQKVRFITDNKSVEKLANEVLESLKKEIFTKNACFAILQNGFSPTRYLRVKADAELDFSLAQKKASQTVKDPYFAPRHMAHPALFARLKIWRDEVAEINGLDLYSVVPTSALMSMAETLPLDIPALKRIKGIGKAKSQLFGADLIGIIQGYCTEYNIEGNSLSGLAAETLAEKAPKVDSKALSLELFKTGKTVDEIATARGLVRSTIQGHLAHYVALGELDVFSLMDKEKVLEIEAFFRENDTDVSSAAKEHFGEKYEYGEIKLVLAYMKKGQVNV